MVRSEESKRLWKLAEATRDWDAMEKVEAEWTAQAEPHIDYPGDDDENEFFEVEEQRFWDEREWTTEDEAGLEEYEDDKRRRIAEANEF